MKVKNKETKGAYHLTEKSGWGVESNIPFGSCQPEWTDYLKTYSSIFGWKISEKWPYHVPFILNFRNFLSNGKHPSSTLGVFCKIFSKLFVVSLPGSKISKGSEYMI